MTKQDFVKAIEKVTQKPFKIRFIKKGKYGKPECWLYPKENPKRQKMNNRGEYLIYRDGSKVMEYTTGILIEEETIENKVFLKDYIESCF